MNNLNQMIKVMALCLIITSLFNGCSKPEANVIKHSTVTCEKVTINITNNLDKEIEDLEIDGLIVGEIKAGDTIEDICLEAILTDSGVYPYLNLAGKYDGQATGQMMIVCGVGLVTNYTGTYEVEITNVENNTFYYNPL